MKLNIEYVTYSIKMMYVLLCIHHSEGWLRQESSTEVTLEVGWGFSEERGISLKVSLHRLLIRKKPITVQWRNHVTPCLSK